MKNKNRWLALALSLCMLLTLLPMGALAVDDPPPETYTWDGTTGALTVHTNDGFEAFKTAVADWNTALQTVVIGNDVTAVPENAFYTWSDDDSPTKLAEKLTSVTFGAGVTSIGENAFLGCAALTAVTLPASLETLGDFAFYCCDGLTAFQVAEGSAHFKAVDGVLFSADGKTLIQYPLGRAGATYTVPSGVETVGKAAFATEVENPTYALRSITFPAGVKTLEDSAVYLESLTSLTFQGTEPPTLAQYGSFGLSADCKIYVPQSAVAAYKAADHWSSYADQIVTVITETVDNENYTFVPGTGAFTVKTNAGSTAWHDAGIDPDEIKSVAVAADVTEIGYTAFADCTNLASVDLGSVTTLGMWAFAGCASLTGVNLGSVTTLGFGAFEDCTSLTSVDLDGVEEIGEGAFSGTGLTAITLPNSLTEIGDWAFSDTALQTVTIPAGVTTIGDAPFAGCANLTAITVAAENEKFTAEEGVLYEKTEGKKTRLIQYPAGRTDKEFTVPYAITTVSAYAFEGAAHLEHVRFRSDNPPTFGTGAFLNCSDSLIIHVPDREAYASLSNSGGAFYGRTVYAPPGAPTGVTAAQVGKDSARLTWTAPTDATPEITGYEVSCTSSNGSMFSPVTLAGDVTSHTFTGLSTGTYDLTVQAINAEGKGKAVWAHVTIAEVEEWNGTAEIQNNGILLLPNSYTGAITIPTSVTNLTIDGQGNPLTGVKITYAEGYTGTLNLTLVNLNITAPERASALVLPKNASLTVLGKNEIAGNGTDSRAIYIGGATSGSPGAVTLTLPGADDALTLTGSSFGISASHIALTLNNSGVLSIESGYAAIAAEGSGTLTVNGTGALYAHSTSSCALLANGGGGVTLNGGRVVAVGGGSSVPGIYSQNSVTIGETVTGLAAGSAGGIVQWYEVKRR